MSNEQKLIELFKEKGVTQLSGWSLNDDPGYSRLGQYLVDKALKETRSVVTVEQICGDVYTNILLLERGGLDTMVGECVVCSNFIAESDNTCLSKNKNEDLRKRTRVDEMFDQEPHKCYFDKS